MGIMGIKEITFNIFILNPTLLISLYTIKENLLTCCSMFSEQTAPIGKYDISIDSEFRADGCMEPKNDPGH